MVPGVTGFSVTDRTLVLELLFDCRLVTDVDKDVSVGTSIDCSVQEKDAIILLPVGIFREHERLSVL